MRAVIQRVKRASVSVNKKQVGKIGAGLLILLAVHQDDNEQVITKMADKILNLRIFDDDKGVMNLSVKDIKGEVLIVSQFTLYGDTSKGKRPSYIKSAKPEKAIPIYNKFVSYIKSQDIKTATGKFGAMMAVELINDGPVTIIVDLE